MSDQPAQLLLVEDDETIAFGLVHALQRDGHSVVHFDNGEEALESLDRSLPDIAILDLMLPGISGLEVLREIKERDPRTPVILLTARSSESDRVEGLDSGADDYITKPFSLKVLMAKIRAWVRRTQIRRGGEEIRLTTHEAAVLSYLVDHKGRPVPREELLEKVWGYSPTMQTRTVDNQILKLRKKVEDNPSDPRHILTIHGVGYRFES
jgi:DNA-binding response OmpR family regulator